MSDQRPPDYCPHGIGDASCSSREECARKWRAEQRRANEERPDMLEELCKLLKECGAVPYLHDRDCGQWKNLPCDKDCGRRAYAAAEQRTEPAVPADDLNLARFILGMLPVLTKAGREEYVAKHLGELRAEESMRWAAQVERLSLRVGELEGQRGESPQLRRLAAYPASRHCRGCGQHIAECVCATINTRERTKPAQTDRSALDLALEAGMVMKARLDVLEPELVALRKVADAARDVWKVCDEAPSFHAVNEIVIERRLSDLEEALYGLRASESSGTPKETK